MTKEELLAQLEELKKGLETSLEQKADDKIKAAEEKLEAVEKSLKELNEKPATVTPEEIKEMKENIAATIKALDIVQVRMKNNMPSENKAPETFEQQLKSAIENSYDNIQKMIRKEKKSFDIELKAVGTVTTANVTGSTTWGAQRAPGIIQDPSRKTHVRSLIDVLPAGPGTDFYFMRENGAGEGAPAPTAEGATKPQFDIDLVEASVKFETIAGWMSISRKALNNVIGLIAFLQSKLPEKLLRAEDAQVLYGDGTSPNIKGILTSGNFVASTATLASALIEKIITDISVLEDTYERSATGILLRPKDYYSFFLNKAAGSGEYDLPQGVSFVGDQLRILGVPVATSTALTAPDYVVGDFANGADIMQQESMRIEFFEQDSDNVRKNLITVRIEETIALPVYGGNYFIKGTTATS